MNKKLILTAAAAVVSGGVLAAGSAATISARAASAPQTVCGPGLSKPTSPSSTVKPSAPTNLRILGGGGEDLDAFDAPTGSGPFVDESEATTLEIEPAPQTGSHAYFDLLTLRPDCLNAYAMRSQADIDAIETGAQNSLKKLPVTYDPAMDAALFRMYAPETTDSKQKLIPIRVDGGAILMTWDFRFDKNFKWEGAGYVAQHKTWRLDAQDNLWLALKTDYQRAANQNRGIAEFIVTLPNSKTAGPGTTRGTREIAEPKLGEFFIEADTWTRVWWLIEDVGQPVAYASLWIGDTKRAPIRLYNRLALNTPADRLNRGTFVMEYDTSMDTALNPVEMHSWNRNFALLKNVPLGDIASLLQMPR